MSPELFVEMAALQEQHWWFVARRRILSSVLDGLPLTPNSRLLEIGCGTGGNLSMLSRYGALEAMEYDPQALAHAERLGICRVLPGGLPAPIPFAEAHFDLVCLFDVLEHIEHDADALRAAARLVKPGGHLVLSVPAYQWLWSAHDRVHHHYRRYTLPHLRRLAVDAGLQVQRGGYFNTLLFPLVALLRGLRRLLGRQDSALTAASDAEMPRPLVNRCLTHLFGLERHWVRHTLFPFGTSVMLVLRRPAG
jgi:SAM-dependent methyltransferase